MGLFSLYPMRYRDRGSLLLVLWKPIVALLVIGWLAARTPGREGWTVIGLVALYLAWLVTRGILRRRGW